MTGYVANNRAQRREITPARDEVFDRQAARQLEGKGTVATSCLVGMRFVWSNGECVETGLPYALTAAEGARLQGGLDARGSFTQTLAASRYDAQLLADTDVDAEVTQAREELQAALDQILAGERAEAAALKAEQDRRHPLLNQLHLRLKFGQGFFLGAWGLLRSAKEYTDLVNPHTQLWNMLVSSWSATVGEQEHWGQAFLRNYGASQHRELVEALGFDPASITREQLADAYELACFIYADGPSKQILGRFAVDYARAQNVEEVAEFGGGAVFEIVLAALLIVLTGGAGLAARGAVSVRYLGALKRLGDAAKRLAAALKRLRLKRLGRASGRGSAAQVIEVERPPAIPRETLAVPAARNWSHLTLSQRHFPHKVTIPKQTGNTMYTVAPEVVARDLAEIHRLGDQIRTGETFTPSSGRTFGIHDGSIHPISGPGTMNITSAEYNILVTAKKKGLDNARKSLEMMTGKGIFSAEQRTRTAQLLDLMQARGVQ
ncbi:hypothetical protein IB229_09275 [Pseudomonas sp. PDM14]|uniref:hypothetical protein n=1 Tax=Pseudomonas sp. PDM14 TaxID=2769288 RepID=UPI001784C01A|nr:hypothetical protein [Pseudomonas sp. PDM14]MBD9483161.1 hypothetical protein [Pseudomonas sp. PDM14]